MSERTEQDSRSTVELVQRLTDQLSQLVRQELQLAKLELAEKGKRTALGAGLLGGSGVFAVYGLAALVAAAILGLATVWPAWLAALVVALVLFALGGLFALVGRGQLKRGTPPLPEQAVAGIKADVEVIKRRAGR
ncbi:MAG TPA: phage holin family protein [Actinomycetes bacterium]